MNDNEHNNKEYNIDLDSVLKESDIDAIELYEKESDDTIKNSGLVSESNNSESKNHSMNSSISNGKFIPIEKTMMIEEIVTVYPEVVPVLMDYGVHCVGCGGASFETLEEGLMGHGAGPEDVDGVVYELNEFLKEKFAKKD